MIPITIKITSPQTSRGNPQKAMENIILMLAQEAKKEFEKTVATWAEKPEFVIEHRGLTANVFTTDKVYRFLNYGTDTRHAVMPKGYRNKTIPGVLASFVGNRDGTRIFVSKGITMPGIKARDWIPLIIDRIEKKIPPEYIGKIIAIEIGKSIMWNVNHARKNI